VTLARSGYKGVTPNGSGWAAKIYYDGKSYHLGTYQTKKQAALAYNLAATKFFGEFAYLNEIVDNKL
jgi:hypothetical protein